MQYGGGLPLLHLNASIPASLWNIDPGSINHENLLAFRRTSGPSSQLHAFTQSAIIRYACVRMKRNSGLRKETSPSPARTFQFSSADIHPGCIHHHQPHVSPVLWAVRKKGDVPSRYLFHLITWIQDLNQQIWDKPPKLLHILSVMSSEQMRRRQSCHPTGFKTLVDNERHHPRRSIRPPVRPPCSQELARRGSHYWPSSGFAALSMLVLLHGPGPGPRWPGVVK